MSMISFDPDTVRFILAGLGISVVFGIAFFGFVFLRRLLRDWASVTKSETDDRVVELCEYSLLPIVVFACVYAVANTVYLSSEYDFFISAAKKACVVFIVAIVFVNGARLVLMLLERLGQRFTFASAVAREQRASLWAVILSVLASVLLNHLLESGNEARQILDPVLTAAVIGTIAWFFVQFIAVAARVLPEIYASSFEDKDSNREQSMLTLFGVLKYVAQFAIVLVAIGASMSQFEVFQTLARSLLASAGIAGIVIGLASQRTIGNLFAGIQLAFAQPVRIGDSVVFEGEWGWIEKISLTYVVIRIWDLRRLVVPITYFLEKPIQNWSMVSEDILGTVFVYTDYRIDIERVRHELSKILESSPLWDKKVPPILQVTDAKEETIELRALCSATDASKAWDLRCYVREELIEFIKNYERGEYLPRTRIMFQREPGH